jgi:hypothetical protein
VYLYSYIWADPNYAFTTKQQYWKLKDSFNSDDFWAPNDPVHPGDQPRIAMAEMMLEKLHRWSAYGV